ncbi:hypothetical protein Y032_0585g325 [Ancylostoma ceylanicum]|uniref:Uncharacterized protein n=1 Tax=Ancylostoma ceylanicum TaxID=53326 RepID=A0A016WMN7_9BILA|nr:hypothetical protein Y032_0585g325 [Ancylostoma ceylanicum]
MEENVCHRGGWKEVVYDDTILAQSLSEHNWGIAEDATGDYKVLLEKLRVCAESASKPGTTNLKRISKATNELLFKRRALRLESNASRIEQLIANASCRRALHEDLQKVRRNKIMKEAEGKRSLKKCRRDLREYNFPMTTLKNEDGIVTFSHREIESISERFFTNLSRSSTLSTLSLPLTSQNIPAGEKNPLGYPFGNTCCNGKHAPPLGQTVYQLICREPEAIIYTVFLQHIFHCISRRKKFRISGEPHAPSFFTRKATKRIFETTVQYAC